MLAWDGSDLALRAFDVAIDIARRYEADLVAVSVAYSPAHAETAADRNETTENAHRYLESTFAEVSERAHRIGLDVRHQVVEGKTPARALVAYATENGFDLIVCGHHRQGRAGRLLLTGLTEELVGISEIPVVVVTAPSE